MKSILIVLSAEELRHRFSQILSQAGYQVIGADSAEKALKLATSVHPDLVLMAIVMPELDGLQAAAQLRALLGPRSAPIILLGTITPLGINDEPLVSLVKEYLSLDASPEELLACVAKHTRATNARIPEW